MVPNWWPESSKFEIKHGSVNHLPKSPVNHKTWLTAFSAWLTQGPSTIKHLSTITIPESAWCPPKQIGRCRSTHDADSGATNMGWCPGQHYLPNRMKHIPKLCHNIEFGWTPTGFVRFAIRMGWECSGVEGKPHANTIYISEFHPSIPTGRSSYEQKLSGPIHGCIHRLHSDTSTNTDPFQEHRPLTQGRGQEQRTNKARAEYLLTLTLRWEMETIEASLREIGFAHRSGRKRKR